MRPKRKPTEDAAARRLRRQKERRRVLRDIQQCIDGTTGHPEWVPELKGCFVRFASVMNRHRAREEKSMYDELPSAFPQLVHRIEHLREEHDRVGTELNALSDSVNVLGDSATPLVTEFKDRGSAEYWHCQLPDPPATCTEPPAYTPQQLEDLLPFLLFGDYVTNLDELRASLALSWPLGNFARRQCATARLNEAADAYGWYSPRSFVSVTRPFWQLYEAAERSVTLERPLIAAWLCASLNRPE